MKKRWIPLGLVGLLLMLQVGLFNGSSIEAGRQSQIKDMKKRWSTTVAVVNSDIGVIKGNALQSYSAAIIESLGDDYALVSPKMAYTGYSNGSYGAVISFPSDTSEKILSFNSSHPEKVRLEFLVNPNLPEKEYIEIYTDIIDLQLSINNTIATTYVGSIYKQFYEAQNQVKSIFDNDHTDMLAVDNVKLQDFTASLALSELPIIPLEPRQMDNKRYMDEVSGFGDDVSGMYLDSYGAASDTYKSMRSGLISMTDNFPQQEDAWLAELTEWTNISVNYGAALTEYSTAVKDFETKMVEWFQKNVEWNQALAQYQTDVAAWHESMVMWFNGATEWYALYQGYLAAAIAYMDEVTAYRTAIAESVAPMAEGLQTWKAEIENRAQSLTEAYQTLVDALAAYNTDVTQTNLYLEALQQWHAEMTAYRSDMETWYLSLTGTQAYLQGVVTDLQSKIAALPRMPAKPVESNYASEPDPTAAYEQALNDWNQELVVWQNGLAAFATELPDLSGTLVPGGPSADTPEMNPDAELPPPRELLTPELEYPWVPEYEGAELPEEWAQDFPESGTILPETPTLEGPAEYAGSVAPEVVGEGPILEATQPENPNIDPPPRPDDFWASLNNMHDQLGSFEVDSYLSDDIKKQVAYLLANYQAYLDTVRADLVNQFAENIQKMITVHDEYALYLIELRSNAVQTEAEEQKKLQDSLTQFYILKEHNSNDTRNRLGAFAEMLPESRMAGGFNQNLIHYTIAPFDFKPPAVRPAMLVSEAAPVQSFNDEYGKYKWILPIMAGALFLSTTAVSLTMRLRKRKATKLESEE